MGQKMALEMVREEEVERDMFALLQEEPHKSWNYTTLMKQLKVTRRKVEKAAAVLHREGKIYTEHVGTSWVIRLHPSLITEKKGK